MAPRTFGSLPPLPIPGSETTPTTVPGAPKQTTPTLPSLELPGLPIKPVTTKQQGFIGPMPGEKAQPPTTTVPTTTTRPIGPQLIEAQRNLQTAQAQAVRAGVPETKIEGITTGEEKPNKGLVALSKVIGFDIVPGKGSFKPIETLVLGPATRLDVGRRAVISTIKEVGDELAAINAASEGKLLGQILPGKGRIRGKEGYKLGKSGFSVSDWWRQTNDLATGYGSTLVPSPTGNKWIDRGIGFMGDVVLDPIAWVAGPAGIAKKPLLEAVEAGGKKAAVEASIAAARSAGAKSVTLSLVDEAGEAVTRVVPLEEASRIAAQLEQPAVQALEQAAKEGPRRVLGARSREELAQVAREAREVALATGNTRVANILTDDVISDLATRSYTAARGEVADVLGIRGGLRAVNPLSVVGIGPDKFRILPQITEPFTNVIGTALTGIRVGFPVKNLPRIFSVINKGFVNTRLGNEILRGTTPIGEGGLFGAEDIRKMRVALRSGNITDPLTGVTRRLTGAEGNDFVRLLAEDRAFRLISAQTNGDVIRVLAPTLADKSFFKHSNTIVDLLDRKIVNVLPDGTKQLVPAVDLTNRTLTAADAAAALGREVSEEEFLFAQQIRGQLDAIYANNNFLYQRQQVAAGIKPEALRELPKNSSYFPHVLTDDSRRALQQGRLPQEALDAMEIDRTFALAGANPRELKVGSTWFGTRLTPEDIAGGVKRLNEIARKSGRVNYDIFETNAENALTRYGQATARDNAYTEFLYRMAQATDSSGPLGSGQFAGKGFADIIQTPAQVEQVGRVPSSLAGFESAVEAVITPERVAYLSTNEGRKRVLQKLVEDMRAFNQQAGKRAGKSQFYDEVNDVIGNFQRQIRDLERISPPVGYPSALDSEANALLESLVNESKGLVLNVNNVKPEDWIRILPMYNDLFGRFVAINSARYPGLAGSPQITELLQNFRRLEDPLIAQALPKALQDTTQMFKAWVTATPGFHTRNALSNIFFLFSAGASPYNISEGARYYSAYNAFLKRTERAAIKEGRALVASNADRIVEDLVLNSGVIPVGLIDSDPALFNKLLDQNVRTLLSDLGPGGKTLFNFYLSPEYMRFAGFPKDFNPYTAALADRQRWLAKVNETYGAVLANATGGYGLLGDVFEGGGRRGISGRTNIRTLAGAETAAEKAAGAASTVSRAAAKPLAWSKEAGRKIEDYTRFMLTYDGLKQGLSSEAAAARTAKYLIDYQDLSQADKAIKQFVPFWTWTSRSFPLIVESAWLNPKAYAIYNSLERNLRDTEGEQGQYTPSYFSGGFKLPIGENIYAMPDFGFQRQEEGLGRLTDPASILASIAPAYRAPIEAAINRRFQTGEDVYNPYYQEAAPAQLQYILQQTLPQGAYAGRLGNIATAGAQDPLTAALALIGAGAGGYIGGPAGAVLGGAAGGAAGLAGQGVAGQVPAPAALESLALALQNLPGVGKPTYVQEEQGPFTREESRQKLASFLGLPVTQLQDYQQVQALKQIIERLEQEAVKAKEKNK